MQSQNYQRTMTACFIAYMVQAVVNNFVPLLFVTFQQTYDIPMAKITLLITLNFLIQLVIDLLSAGFVDKIGYRASVILAHICAAAGFVLLTILPEMLSDPFVGILIAVMIYAVGGGLIEVLISPIVEACPTDNKEKAMSLRVNGNFAPVIWKIRRKMGSQPIYGRKLRDVCLFVPLHRLCAKCRGQFIGLCGLRFFCGNPLAGDIQ